MTIVFFSIRVSALILSPLPTFPLYQPFLTATWFPNLAPSLPEVPYLQIKHRDHSFIVFLPWWESLAQRSAVSWFSDRCNADSVKMPLCQYWPLYLISAEIWYRKMSSWIQVDTPTNHFRAFITSIYALIRMDPSRLHFCDLPTAIWCITHQTLQLPYIITMVSVDCSPLCFLQKSRRHGWS